MADRDVNTLPLPSTVRGRRGPPIVLVHGFGGERAGWDTLAVALAPARRVIAFDLPGHGEAAAWTPTPDAAAAARAIIASLAQMGIDRASFVGHSLGGAVAALVGLMRPDLAERLVLLAPGGFGPAMNARLLRRYAEAQDEATLRLTLETFLAPTAALPDDFLAAQVRARKDPGLRRSLAAIVTAITRGDGQGTLPLDALAAAPFPTSLIWGLEDMVLPVRQAIEAPAGIARHLLPGVGHMPHLEAPDLVRDIILRTLVGRTG
ncbi:MAG: alpha/beta fold hydrolase [Acuticoccus sp.]